MKSWCNNLSILYWTKKIPPPALIGIGRYKNTDYHTIVLSVSCNSSTHRIANPSLLCKGFYFCVGHSHSKYAVCMRPKTFMVAKWGGKYLVWPMWCTISCCLCNGWKKNLVKGLSPCLTQPVVPTTSSATAEA